MWFTLFHLFAAADALVHVAGHPDMNKYPSVVNELISSILGLNDLLQKVSRMRAKQVGKSLVWGDVLSVCLKLKIVV